jgi:3-oxoacyl-[acyl-carrier-protein] synthase II
MWEAAKNGMSGIGRITRFDASALPWRLAGEVKGFCSEAFLHPKEIRRLDPFVHFAVSAALMATEDARLISADSTRTEQHAFHDSAGVIIGSSRGGIGTIEQSLLAQDSESRNRGPRSAVNNRRSRVSPYLMPATTINMAASYVAQRMGFRGHCLGISNACASGTNAIGEAFRVIKSGYSPLMIAGGAEAPVCRLCVEGYGTAGALSSRGESPAGAPDSPRPFDAKRDGFVLSEGACMLVLEEYDHALRRGVPVYGEIIGYGNCSDAYHMTKPDADGEARAMALSLTEAGIGPTDVAYINTHGTGTRLGDEAEAHAIRTIFGEASTIPATALKSMTGHMLAASGALEIASTLMTLREGVIPPTINLDEKDPACQIHVLTKAAECNATIAISNSFGFGGVNAVIVLKKA